MNRHMSSVFEAPHIGSLDSCRSPTHSGSEVSKQRDGKFVRMLCCNRRDNLRLA